LRRLFGGGVKLRAWFAGRKTNGPGISAPADGAVRIPLKLGAHQAGFCEIEELSWTVP